MANVTDAAPAASPTTASTVVVVKERRKLPGFVRVREHVNCFYFWPVAVVALAFYPLVSFGLADLKVAGWWMISTLAVSMLASTVNLGRTMTIILIFAFLGVGGVVWGAEAKGYYVLQTLGRYLRSVAPSYEAGLCGWIGALGAVFFLYSQGHAWLIGRWKLGHNGFEHVSVGKRGRIIPRAGRTVQTEYPDLLKAILGFGAGDIKIRTGNAGRDLEAVIKNVPFLWFKDNRIQEVLESVSTVNREDDEVAANETLG